MTKDKSQPAVEKPESEAKATKPTENLYVFPNYNGKGKPIRVTATTRKEAIEKAEVIAKEQSNGTTN